MRSIGKHHGNLFYLEIAKMCFKFHLYLEGISYKSNSVQIYFLKDFSLITDKPSRGVVNVYAHNQPHVFRCQPREDRKSTRLNSSHVRISYAVFCLKKKKKKKKKHTVYTTLY